MRNAAAIVAIMLMTLLVQVSIGMSAVMFPVKLDDLGFNKIEIGLLLAIEIFAVLAISTHISRLLARFGMLRVVLLASLLRVLVMHALPGLESFLAWMLCLFVFGLATNVLLIALQSWLGALRLKRFSGLVLGIFSAILSAGVAAGPWVLEQTGQIGELAFQANLMLCALAAMPILFCLLILPKLTASDRPRLLYTIQQAPVVMGSAFVGGITFFGLPAFLTLVGIQNGLQPEQAAYLISSFMLGSIFIGLAISALSDLIGTGRLIVVCVFLGLACSVYFPLAITHYTVALVLLFVWGGVMGGVYAMGLAVINTIFRKDELVSANVAFGLLDCMGGVVGVFLIGVAMELWQAEGLSYVIVAAGLAFFVFVLSQKNVLRFAQ